MKTNKYILALAMALSLFSFSSCSEDDLDPESIFKAETAQAQQNEFDTWLKKNFTDPYNIRFIYRLEDMEADFDYTVSPADFELSQTLAKIVKYAWLEAYDEVAGIDFTRAYVPKIIHLLGSAQYESNGTMVLGTAEGGLKVTLNLVNYLTIDRDFLNTYYFRTMHHEFTHILNQTKSYDTETFEQISSSDYIAGDWYLAGSKSDEGADSDGYPYVLHHGFIRNYAMSSATEDFADMTAIYICSTPDEWEKFMSIAGEKDSNGDKYPGSDILNQKLSIIKSYFKETWSIDLDDLRDAVNARMNDVVNGRVDLSPIVTIE